MIGGNENVIFYVFAAGYEIDGGEYAGGITIFGMALTGAFVCYVIWTRYWVGFGVWTRFGRGIGGADVLTG